MTRQIDRLAQLVEVELARGLLHLRRASLSAEDLERLSLLRAARLNRADRRQVAGLIARVRLASARAGEAAGNRGGVLQGHGNDSENAALPRHGARFREGGTP